MSRLSRLLAVLLLLGASCGSSVTTTPIVKATPVEPEAPATAPAAPEPPAPALRLPATVRPTRYAARLRVVPREEELRGIIAIDLVVAEPTEVIWLNGNDITVEDAVLHAGAGARIARPLTPRKDFLGLAFDGPVPAGEARLEIAYRAKLPRSDYEGAFAQEENGAWYVFTQFEATDARRAFPCFDEPAYKVPWQLSLEVPAGDDAVANTPITSEQALDGGMKLVTFAETRPLPSYLIAFAVGPFDFVPAGKSGGGAPIRIVTPRGRAGEAAYAVEATAPLLAILEDYFGTPYPYEKLDLIAVPHYGPGAMENPGLITFRLDLLLSRPEELTPQKQRRYAWIAAHEMAHQWFGDLVTMAWWDDIWLNEAFASWMEDKVLERWKPEWELAEGAAAGVQRSMGGDSLASARKIRQPIQTSDDIANAFDGITYGKGAAVIAMFERWLGPEVFQKGVRAYLARHADGNATSADFLGALGEAAGRDVATPFSTFLDQVGAPLVSFTLTCARGQKPKLALAQRRYLPIGSTASSDQVWQLPVCVRWAAGGQKGHDCTLLSAAGGELELAAAKKCPDWVAPNRDALGYYHAKLEGDLLDRLLKKGLKKLTLPERIGLIGDLNALVASGDVPVGTALGLIETLAREPSRHLSSQSVHIAAGLEELIPEELRPNYRRFLRKVYGARARALGFAGPPDEDDDDRLMRATMIGLVAGAGGDEALVAEATRLAWAWLDDKKAVQPDMADVVLGIAAMYGDKKLWDRLHADARAATDRRDRARLLGALGSFRDPALAQAALALILTEEFPTREAMTLVWAALQHPESRQLAYDFVKANFDALVAKLPREYGAYLPYVGAGFCDDTHRADVDAFFRERVTQFTGGPRVLEQVLEAMSLCTANRQAQQPGIVAFLEKY